MCTKPFLLRNPRTQKYISVPCGTCEECKACKRVNVSKRLESQYYETLQTGGTVVFLTLTYAPHSLPYFNNVKCFNRDDVVMLLRRLRARIYKNYKLGKSLYNHVFKYLITCEYGTKNTHRPHYHGILFFERKVNVSYIKSLISELWFQGQQIRVEQANSFKSCKYVTKYVIKDINGGKLYKNLDNLKERIKKQLFNRIKRYYKDEIKTGIPVKEIYYRLAAEFRNNIVHRPDIDKLFKIMKVVRSKNHFTLMSKLLGASYLSTIYSIQEIVNNELLKVPNYLHQLLARKVPHYSVYLSCRNAHTKLYSYIVNASMQIKLTGECNNEFIYKMYQKYKSTTAFAFEVFNEVMDNYYFDPFLMMWKSRYYNNNGKRISYKLDTPFEVSKNLIRNIEKDTVKQLIFNPKFMDKTPQYTKEDFKDYYKKYSKDGVLVDDLNEFYHSVDALDTINKVREHQLLEKELEFQERRNSNPMYN